MAQLFFGSLVIDKNFLSNISEIFFQKKFLIAKDFDNLEDFFRYSYYELGEKVAKNFLSITYNIELLYKQEMTYNSFL